MQTMKKRKRKTTERIEILNLESTRTPEGKENYKYSGILEKVSFPSNKDKRKIKEKKNSGGQENIE